jgi:hypothetical protein
METKPGFEFWVLGFGRYLTCQKPAGSPADGLPNIRTSVAASIISDASRVGNPTALVQYVAPFPI